jgi:hypothetical protein
MITDTRGATCAKMSVSWPNGPGKKREGKGKERGQEKGQGARREQTNVSDGIEVVVDAEGFELGLLLGLTVEETGLGFLLLLL